MKQKRTIYYVLAALMLLASCKTEDETTLTLYGDAAITSFTLGTLNRYVAGEKITYAGSAYPMQIDAVGKTIENVDSLLIYTDASHVVCTVGTRNNGIIGIKSLTDDTYKTYSSSDSIDFSQERTFRVWASDGGGYTDYKVKVNVHKQDGEETVWQKQTGATKPTETLPTGIKQLLGKSSYEAYAISEGGKVMHKATNATDWTQDIADDHEDIASVPSTDIALVSYPMALADSMDYVLLAGTVSGTKTAVWRKIVDNRGKKATGNWTYLDRGSETQYLLPALTGLNLIRYDGVVLAFGGDFKQIYESRDNGITWKVSSRILMPSDFDYSQAKKMLVKTDADNYIWLYCDYADGSLHVWKGRLNRLGWKNN